MKFKLRLTSFIFLILLNSTIQFAFAIPYGANFYDTSEYMMGKVAVGIIFVNSDGSQESRTEQDWTQSMQNEVLSEVQAAMSWWNARESRANLSFVYVTTTQSTGYEPISRPNTDQNLWINEIMGKMGYTDSSYFDKARRYCNDIRNSNAADWAFVIFLVNSSNDADGKFAINSSGETLFGYAYLGGPFQVMTYDNDGYGISNLDTVCAHETGHIFYALDEYVNASSVTAYSGYLNIQNGNHITNGITNNACIMRSQTAPYTSGSVCSYTREMIGWRDTDADNIFDILDTDPETLLTVYAPDPTDNTTIIYFGTATVTTYLNSNSRHPLPMLTSRNININTITDVSFRIDSGTWLTATAVDGSFDNNIESYTFIASTLTIGQHNFETRSINSVGNYDSSPASDSLNIDNFPVLSWTEETNYISDGIDPEIGVTTTSFVYRIKYTDSDNDAPLTNYSKVHILKNNTEISGSPFSMTYVTGNYNTGAIYTYSKILSVPSTDYAYYFEAYDINGASATTILKNTPDVINIAPTLSWTEETNYLSDGIDSETGVPTTSFVYRIKYTDSDNNAPLNGYPKIHILKNNTEITGSPFSMTYATGNYNTGTIYTYSKILSVLSTDYAYYFEAYDVYNATAIGTPMSIVDAPDVTNIAPTLSWTEETNYISDGIDPEIGVTTTSFTYRIKYTDSDNNAPLNGYPKLHILRNGSEISGSPFSMTYVAGNYNTGMIYTYSKTLSVLNIDYTYYFEAYDIYSATATDVPLSIVDAPDVLNIAPALSWTEETNYISDGIDPEIGVTTTSFTYRIKYTDSDNNIPLNGYPKVHILKNGTEISGSPFSMSYDTGTYNTGAIYVYSTTHTLGTDYTYYFEAQDSIGTNASATVLKDAPDVINISPTLSWAEETNYISDGIDPETGLTSTSFVYRIKYTDSDNDAPLSGYPKVHILKNGTEISGSPFSMTYIAGNYFTGAIYFYSTILMLGTDYAYYFETKDALGSSAVSTASNDAPDVTGYFYINGYVRTSDGKGIENVSVTLSGYNSSQFSTTANGYYEFTNLLSHKNYTVTPIKTKDKFSPENINISSLDTNKNEQNFTGSIAQETETVKPAGFHLSSTEGYKKKIRELKEKIELNTP